MLIAHENTFNTEPTNAYLMGPGNSRTCAYTIARH